MSLVRCDQPGWQPVQGICPDCALRYAGRLAAERSADSLHTLTGPPTTFPYYHQSEESVLGQPARLPDYATFDGRGVTIALLDSGYYPHPDLTSEPHWPDMPTWERLDSAQMQKALRQRGTRLAHYVDLTDHGEQAGLDTPSLWDGAGDSWHGQMTSVVAAGNGLLSAGRLRGYAPAAGLLPIKIGRGGGRIPEDDILAGMQWLLRDDHWARYGVRVLNVSVGGDFEQAWDDNPVCRAADELVHRGVFVAAAAGNSGRQRLLAPAQTPSLLTVGGYDDHNRRVRWEVMASRSAITLYPHNWDTVGHGAQRVAKPEMLGLGRWMPGPILPVSPIFKEMHAIDRLRQTLAGGDREHLRALLQHWHTIVHVDPEHPDRWLDVPSAQWLPEVWQALRKRMNAHKWIHAHYQHVEGTSVAAAQASAVAAQMLQANPNLTPAAVKALLVDTAQPLPYLPRKLAGEGVLQPTAAVAAALRLAGGPLTGLPGSGAILAGDRLHTWLNRVKVMRSGDDSGQVQVVYLGYLAPQARRVSVVGPFNRWQPELAALERTASGWWHGLLLLPPGVHVYRFWVDDSRHPRGQWAADPEHAMRAESGYQTDHSVITVTEAGSRGHAS